MKTNTVKSETNTNLRNAKTNQFDRTYVEHGRYTKIQYGIRLVVDNFKQVHDQANNSMI
jgi:hypothetical protein